MRTIKPFAIAVLIAAGASPLLTPTARADEKIVTTTTVSSPQITAMRQNMNADQKAQMAQSGYGGAVDSTIYLSGNKIKIEMANVVYLIDPTAQSMFILNPATHTYASYPYKQADPNDSFLKTATINKVDTGETKIILGHKARHYTIVMTMPQGPSSIATKGDVWAADDLVQPDFNASGAGALEVMLDQLKTIKGLPLDSTVNITSGPGNGVTLKSSVTAVSTETLSQKIFDVPANYKRAK